jgi:hypothetical protein
MLRALLFVYIIIYLQHASLHIVILHAWRDHYTCVHYLHFYLTVHLVPWLFTSYLNILVLFGIVHIVVETSLSCSNILLYLVVRNTDYAQIGFLQFFIVYGVCEIDNLF